MNAIQNIMPDSKINIYDPIVKIKDLQKISEHCFTNFYDSILDSDVIVICNNHEFFSSNDLRAMLAKNQKIKLVYDFWNHFDHLDTSQKKELNYVTYGSHWLVNKGIDI